MCNGEDQSFLWKPEWICSFSRDSKLLQMSQHVIRIGVDAKCTGAFQFILTGSAGEHSDSKRALPNRSQQIQVLSPTTIESLIETPRRSAARTKASGAGLVLATSSPVITGIFLGIFNNLRRRCVC